MNPLRFAALVVRLVLPLAILIAGFPVSPIPALSMSCLTLTSLVFFPVSLGLKLVPVTINRGESVSKC